MTHTASSRSDELDAKDDVSTQLHWKFWKRADNDALFLSTRQALGLPLSDLCLSETKESLPTTKDQLRRVGGDSVDDVSTVGAPCRCLAHNWLRPGVRGRMGCAHSQPKQQNWVTQLDGGPGRVKGTGQSVLVVSFERHHGPQVSACLCWPALVLSKSCLLEKSSM